jgi:hypothetical protein
MPARSASAGHADGIGRCGLIQRCHRHGLGRGDSRKADADRKQGRSKYFHGLSFLLVREEKMTSGQMNSANLTNGDGGASDDGDASDGANADASGDANAGANGHDDASALLQA